MQLQYIYIEREIDRDDVYIYIHHHALMHTFTHALHLNT